MTSARGVVFRSVRGASPRWRSARPPPPRRRARRAAESCPSPARPGTSEPQVAGGQTCRWGGWWAIHIFILYIYIYTKVYRSRDLSYNSYGKWFAFACLVGFSSGLTRTVDDCEIQTLHHRNQKPWFLIRFPEIPTKWAAGGREGEGREGEGPKLIGEGSLDSPFWPY